MDVTDEMLALAEIERFAPDDGQSFLLMDHTLKHWRESLWLPALGVLAIINFAWNWNNFFEPLIYLNSTERFTVALGLTLFQGRMNREIPGLMAMTLISMIPVLITFYIAQRYFIQGIVISGIKG